MIRTPSAAAISACAHDGFAGQGLPGPAITCCLGGMPLAGGMRRVSAEMDAVMPKKQTAAGKRARAGARGGEKYATALRRQLVPGTGPVPDVTETGAAHPTCLDHRSLLHHPPGFRPFRGTDLFERIGGQPAINKLVDLLYAGFEDDEQLRPLFLSGLARGRSAQRLFFAEWLGGPRRYSEQSHAGLRHRHDSLPITPMLASRWLEHFGRALEAAVAAENDRMVIFAQVRALALALVNGQVAPARHPMPENRPGGKDARGSESENGPHQVAWCGIGARSVRQARDLARRGDVAGVSAALEEAPDLLRPTYAAAIMQAGALAGRAEIIRMLLDRGVAADHPFYLPVRVTGVAFERVIFVTPLCAARMKRRSAVESLLMAAGASEDVFTSALLGDLTSLAQMLAADPDLAQATDPAVDVLDITPVEHAVAGGQVATLRLILDHVTHPLPGAVRALRGAAAQGSLAMVELLLAHGADATRLGAGHWVLHLELAPLLASRGATIDSSGSWIGASCTGNQGRKDDPEYVRALLRHGARATDRRTGDPECTTGVRALNATALHYAAKAGFLRTIEVLLDHGADPGARDSRGRTPLDWLEQSAPSASQSRSSEPARPWAASMISATH
jgi:truncated hemoglobin YjbI/ankyrin repeat protein